MKKLMIALIGATMISSPAMAVNCEDNDTNCWKNAYDESVMYFSQLLSITEGDLDEAVELNKILKDKLKKKEDEYDDLKDTHDTRGQRLDDIHDGLDDYRDGDEKVNYKTISKQDHKQDDYEVSGNFEELNWYHNNFRQVLSVDTRGGEIEPPQVFVIHRDGTEEFLALIQELDIKIYGAGYVDGVNDGFNSGYNKALKDIQDIEGGHYNP